MAVIMGLVVSENDNNYCESRWNWLGAKKEEVEGNGFIRDN